MRIRFSHCFAVLFAGSVVACNTEPVAPPVTRAPDTAATTLSGEIPGEYLVLLRNASSVKGVEDRVAALGGTVQFMHGESGLAIVSGLSESAAAELASANGVAAVQPNVAFTIDAPVASVESELATDEILSVANPATAARYAWQWNMRLINADDAWAAGKLGDPGVTVAIIDSGIDYNIPDMNGLVDLSRSTSFVASDNALSATYFPTRNNSDDFHGHGTNVATQVSSKAVALAGVTSKTTLISVKVLSRTGAGNTGTTLAGIVWAADHGARIANASIGGEFVKNDHDLVGLLPYITRIFNYANQKGMLIVVAAGNSAVDMDHDGNAVNTYCSSPHVVCVAAVGPRLATSDKDEPSYYTNFGRSAITVAAPGGNADAANSFTTSAWPWGTDIASWVWSYCPKYRIAGLTAAGVPVLTACFNGNRLSGAIGTSQAAPHVAGEAASILAANPGMSASDLKQAIIDSSDDLGQTGTDPYYGKGRINVAKAHGL